VFGEERADEQLERYHEVEPGLQTGGDRTYREVMAATLADLGAPENEWDALSLALPAWQPFPEVRPALEEARSRGWKLAILSNTDRDFIEASMRRIAGVRPCSPYLPSMSRPSAPRHVARASSPARDCSGLR